MKKISTLLLVCLFVFSVILSGCSTNNASDGSNAATPSEDNNTSEQNNTASGETTSVTFWFPGNEKEIDEAVKKIAANFEAANPNIKVEVTTIPWKDYFQKLSVAYAGGIEPDVHGLGFGQLISTVEQDKYMDLNKFIQAEPWSGQDDVFPSIMKAGQWNGGQYGLLIPETRPFVWRKDFFEEAGLDPNTPPQSLDEIFEYAEKLTVKDGDKTIRAGIDIQTSNGEQSLLSLLLLQGQNLYTEAGEPTFDSPTTIATVERMTQLFENGAILPASQQELKGTPFQNSLAAMGFQSSYSLGQLTSAIGQEKIGWSLPPKGPEGAQTALMLGTFLTMSKTTAQADAAWEFIKFFYSPDQIFEFSKSTGFVPPLQSLKDRFEGLGEANKVIFSTVDDAEGYLPSSDWGTMMKYLRVGLEEAYYGKKTPEEAMRDAAEQTRKEIGK